MFFKKIIITSLLVIALPVAIYARPVSYPGGWTVMQFNDADSNSLHLHYSPTVNYSLGYRGIYFNDQDWSFHGLQHNYLLKRWNKIGSQANLYLKNSIGLGVDHDSSEENFAGFTGFATDWETRRYFLSYQARYLEAGSIDGFFQQSARVGVAPYLGEYGDIHTWIMLQTDHLPEDQDPLRLTPIIRFFKAEYLLETGVSFDGDVLVNWIIRF